jgi:hypothetical protein
MQFKPRGSFLLSQSATHCFAEANSYGRRRLLGTGAVEKVEGLFLDGSRARGDGEGDARRGGDFNGVFGERGGDQGLEAVDGQAVRGAAGRLLATAASERWALATTLERSASAASLSSSS